jgi:hypothetical protein
MMTRQGMFAPSQDMNMGNEQPVAILWGGRESNPSSIVVRDRRSRSIGERSLLHCLDVSKSRR